MVTCINKSLPEYKKLEKMYGDALAERLVYGYSEKVMKLDITKDLVYPTKTQISDWFKRNRLSLANDITYTLTQNPSLSEDAILSLLKGVLHKYEDKIFITRGYTNKATLAEKIEGKKLVFDINNQLINTLSQRFPNIFKIKETSAKDVVLVEINPELDPEIAKIVKERATEVYAFEQAMNYTDQFAERTPKSRMIAVALAEKFKKAFGMNYEIITKDQAIEILADTKTPYNNQTAFFYDNKIYFIDGHFNYYNILHEYGHPLIKGIAQQNRKLFDNLFDQLSMTNMGKTIIGYVENKYPQLKPKEGEEYSDRFKEEALVSALEYDAMGKVNELIEDPKEFKNFITKLLYAIKQVLRKLTRNVNLKTLSSTTTLKELSDMMLNEDFMIEDLGFDKSEFAEFNVEDIKEYQKEREKILKELKSTDAKLVIDVINRAYTEAIFQINTLNQTPGKLKDKIKGSEFREIREKLSKYQTINIDSANVSEEDILNAMREQEIDFRERSIAFVESLNEVQVFTKRIQNVLKEMGDSGAHLKTEGYRRVAYYIQFLNRQKEFLDSIRQTLALDETNAITKKVLSIKDVVDEGLRKAKQLQFEFITDFMTEESNFMQEDVFDKFRESATRILKADNFTEDEIDEFISYIKNKENKKSFNVGESPLSRTPKNVKYLNDAVQTYFAKRLVKADITSLLKGESGDLGLVETMLNNYGNIDDPIGAFVRYTKNKLASAEVKSLKMANEIANDLAPHLKAMGYDANNVTKLADMLLFVDKVPSRNENGDYVDFEVYTVLNRFKDYRAVKGKLEYDLEKAKEEEDSDKIVKAVQALKQFSEDYMHRRYTKAYYDVQKIWNQDNTVLNPVTGKETTVSKDVSTEAFIERQDMINKMNTFSSTYYTEDDDLYEASESQQLRLEYEELYNLFDFQGNYKQGKELEKVLVRRLHREKSRNFRETSINYDKVQRDYNHFVTQVLPAKGLDPEALPEKGEEMNAYNKEIQKFFQKNFKISFTDAYWQEFSRIMSELDKINSLTNNPISNKLTDLYKERSNYVKMVKDNYGQPNGAKLGSVRTKRLKEIEEEIVKLQTDYDVSSGLTKDESKKLISYNERVAKEQGTSNFTQYEKNEYNTLIQKSNIQGLTPELLQKQRGLIQELGLIKSVLPTEYYVKIFNENLSSEVDVEELTLDNANEWINSDKLITALAEDNDFADWFTKNHYKREYINKKGELKTKWYRLKSWSTDLPVNEDHIEKTELVDPITKKPFTVFGTPVGKYSSSRVKNEYRTGYNPSTGKVELKVGVHIDNRGNFLPRVYDGTSTGAKDKAFINEEYERLEKENGSRFQFIKAYSDNLLKVQEGKARASKLYLDLPRFRLENDPMQYLRRGGLGETLKAVKDNTLSYLKKSVDQAEQGFNFDANTLYVPTDLQGQPITTVPIRGLYRMDKNVVSKDPLKSLAEYMYSLNAQDALKDGLPIAEALSDVLNDPANAIKNVNKASLTYKKNAKITRFIPERTDNKRAQALDYFIDKVYYGQGQDALSEDSVKITKIAQGLMRSAHRAYAALDISAALKNKYGMLFQTLVETAGGKYINAQSLALGRVWAHQAMIQLSTKDVYSKGPKSLMIQLMENFDPITGKTKADFGKSTSRTFLKDFLNGTWMYDPRTHMEVQEGLTLFAAMMYRKKVDQVQPDGSVKQIRYIDAWELNSEKQLVLKQGVDPRYGTEGLTHEFTEGDTLESIAKQYKVTVEELIKINKIKDVDSIQVGDDITIYKNDKFLDFRLKIKGLGKKLNGMTDDVDSAQANKYLLYRLGTFYRKFALPMFLNRFQADLSKENRWGEVYDWDLGTTTKGYYITAFQSMYKLVTDAKNYWPLMSKEDKIAITKVISEGLYVALLYMAVVLLFGYDSGDEDRFNKIRSREETYGAFGWAANHVLYQLIMIRKENEMFIPLPGLGVNDWLEFTDSTTIVTGPTLDLYAKLITDLFYIVTGSDKAYYKRAVGPYAWQDEGKYKLWNHFFSLFGIKGKNWSPEWAIKKAEMFENLK